MRWCLVFPIKGTKFSEPTHNCASGLDAILTASTSDREFPQLNFFYNTQLKRHTVIALSAFYIIASFFHNNDFFFVSIFQDGTKICNKKTVSNETVFLINYLKDNYFLLNISAAAALSIWNCSNDLISIFLFGSIAKISPS